MSLSSWRYHSPAKSNLCPSKSASVMRSNFAMVPFASLRISVSMSGSAAIIRAIVRRRSEVWYIQIKFSSSTVKCIIPHTSNSFFLVLAAAFFGLVACLLSASCLRIDGRGLRILTSRRSSLLIMAYTPSPPFLGQKEMPFSSQTYEKGISGVIIERFNCL